VAVRGRGAAPLDSTEKKLFVSTNPTDPIFLPTVKFVCVKMLVLPVYDKPYHMNNGFQQMWAEIKNCEYVSGNKQLFSLLF